MVLVTEKTEKYILSLLSIFAYLNWLLAFIQVYTNFINELDRLFWSNNNIKDYLRQFSLIFVFGLALISMFYVLYKLWLLFKKLTNPLLKVMNGEKNETCFES